VLGPPRDAAMLKVTERPSEMYGLSAVGGSLAAGLNSAFSVRAGESQLWDDANAPFDSVDGFPLSYVPVVRSADLERTYELLRECYTGNHEDAWRRIDNDWLGVGADLAIQLDKRTNNSSLVLAFEFVDTKRVLLFVGDAQVGNWLSWKELKWQLGESTVSAHDLLARTVFYKVGHHGSHNATLKKNGLELMTCPDLSAFIPTNAVDASKVGWGEMPFEPLLADLKKRTNNRVIRADDPWLKHEGEVPSWLRQTSGQQPDPTVSGAIRKWRHDMQNSLWIELDIG
jgi:hypothetical protein